MQCSCCGDYKRSKSHAYGWYVCSNPGCRLHYCDTCVSVQGMERHVQVKTEHGYQLQSEKYCIYCRSPLETEEFPAY